MFQFPQCDQGDKRKKTTLLLCCFKLRTRQKVVCILCFYFTWVSGRCHLRKVNRLPMNINGLVPVFSWTEVEIISIYRRVFSFNVQSKQHNSRQTSDNSYTTPSHFDLMGRTTYTIKTPEAILEHLEVFSDMHLIHRLHCSWLFLS